MPKQLPKAIIFSDDTSLSDKKFVSSWYIISHPNLTQKGFTSLSALFLFWYRYPWYTCKMTHLLSLVPIFKGNKNRLSKWIHSLPGFLRVLCTAYGLHDGKHIQRGFRARASSWVSDPFLPFLIREAKTAQTVSENFCSGADTFSSSTHLDLGS